MFYKIRNELQDVGFPPKFYYNSLESGEGTSYSHSDKKSSSSSLSPYVTIGSIDFSGKMVIKVRSRVLDKELIKDVELDLDYLDSINERIRDAAEKSKSLTNRRGCTTDELYSIIQKYFNELLRKVLRSTTANLAFAAFSGNDRKSGFDQSSIKAKKALSGAKEILTNYAKSVSDKTTKEIEKNFAEIGISPEHIGIAKEFLSTELFENKKSNDG